MPAAPECYTVEIQTMPGPQAPQNIRHFNALDRRFGASDGIELE